jgi:hypothetical protein
MKAIVFSRDRACQLDLLLTSLEVNAPDLFDVTVIWMARLENYRRSYEICRKEHPDARFLHEDGLTYQVRSTVARERGLVTFFTDDDVLYRPVGNWAIETLGLEENWICFSLRLGSNTDYCYPLDRSQRVPDLMPWKWEEADGDFGYPMSLDGHIFRASDLDMFLGGRHFGSPNFLEEMLMASALQGVVHGTPFREKRPLMMAYPESRLVGIPANRVQTKNPNRHGERHPYLIQDLNDRYLKGERIDLDALDFSDIRGAHQEMELVFR